MSMGRRYTANNRRKDALAVWNYLHAMHENDPSSDLKAARDTARLLYDDALETESQVAGLMEALEELLPIADSSETNGPAEWARIHEAREALSKFRGGV